MAFRKYPYGALIALADGVKSSSQLARELGWPVKTVQKIMLKLDLPRRKMGPFCGELNPSWKAGRIIDRDGYCLVRAPQGHPFARKTGYILEHRLIMEKHLGRYLQPLEVIDHIDGNKLNNSLGNLRLFQTNSDHLKATLTGKTPKWSEAGYQNMQTSALERKVRPRVDTHDQNKKLGVIREQQVSLARAQLCKDNPDHVEMLKYLNKYQKV